ncbi:MAG: hypothetical protein AAGE59_37820 [Cyanobacteria bacterium P01_F01_bin.86]
MDNLREELNEVIKMKRRGGGFHYVERARKLMWSAQQARHWRTLLKTPIKQWQATLSETRQILDKLASIGISK